jgi:hypothetical protein
MEFGALKMLRKTWKGRLKNQRRNGEMATRAGEGEPGVSRFETVDDLRNNPTHMTHSGHFRSLRNLATINC